ncbi:MULTISPECIES: response regulator [Capnocytophaga]|uniref:response regulator n=1 Tax=Capnocytophaga TaxID=1016 RepID=UPI000BB1C6F2|nr:MULTISPECIES: response regulator [Capnocytophaga]ATA75643.1 response regulator [Capnocytophaga sp. H2931]GIM61405.1 hypothetical protein CAPN008_14550 [Capnocytophaga canis]
MKFRYIVVEDDTNVWENIRIRMQSYPQWEALEFSSELTDAIEKITQHLPEMIFSDWSIRGGNAYQILNYISTIENYNPYVIFFTGYQSENPEIPQRIINDFPIVNKYIVKPIYENLTNHLQSYVREAEKQAIKSVSKKGSSAESKESEGILIDTSLGKVRIFMSEFIAVLQQEGTRSKMLYLKNNCSYELKQTWEEIFTLLEESQIDYFVAHNRKSVINKVFIKTIVKPYVFMENDLSIKVSREQWRKLETFS